MGVLNRFYACPVTCTAAILPVLAVAQDCNTEFYSSQITKIYFLPKYSVAGALNPLPTAMTAAVFNALILNTDLTGVRMKELGVEGGIGASEKVTIQYRKTARTTRKKYTLTAEIKDLTDVNYEFVRALECQSFIGYIWYETDDHIFGGFSATNGTTDRIIEVNQAEGDIELAQADDAIQTGKITITWDARTSPRRTARFR